MSDVWGLASFVDTMHSRTALGSHARLYWSEWHVCGLLFSVFSIMKGRREFCVGRDVRCAICEVWMMVTGIMDFPSVNDGHRHCGFAGLCSPMIVYLTLATKGRRLFLVARDVWCAIFDFRWAKCEWGHRHGGFPGSVLWILSIFDVRFVKCSSRSVNEVRIASSFSPVIVDATMPTNGRRSFCIVSDIRWAICDERLISEICEVWMRVTQGTEVRTGRWLLALGNHYKSFFT